MLTLPPHLNVWLCGHLIGQLRPLNLGRALELRLSSPHPMGIRLSLSLPATSASPLSGPGVTAFFRNLLSDSEQQLIDAARPQGVAPDNLFGLLALLGADCAGGVQMLHPEAACPGQSPGFAGALTAPELEVLLAGGHQQLPVAIAGAQKKTALTRAGATWFMPSAHLPSTHILKFPLGLVGNSRVPLAHSLENEYLCLRILKAFGMPVANAEVLRPGGTTPVIAVERFDRCQLPGAAPQELRHQEDCCQALGLPPHLKYESDGGPGFHAIARLLQGGERGAEDVFRLLQTQVLFWMLLATDGHAKNFSIVHLAGGGYQLAPLYDVISFWPYVGKDAASLDYRRRKMAMAAKGKNTHYTHREIRGRHFQQMADQVGLGFPFEGFLSMLLHQSEAVVAKVRGELPAGFPMEMAEAVFAGMLRCARQLAPEE